MPQKRENICKAYDLLNEWMPPHEDEKEKWRPLSKTFPNWTPDQEKWLPLDELANARKEPVKPTLPKEIADRICDEMSGDVSDRKTIPCEKGRTHFHCYSTAVSRANVWRQWVNLPASGEARNPWYCNSFNNAADHYSWSRYYGGDFHHLARALQSALNHRCDLRTAVACLLLLDWGGVLKGRTKSKATIFWMANTHNLIQEISTATACLCPQSSKDPSSVFNTIPMNSGSTKIFSAAAMDFSNGNIPMNDVIIFDGRVSAALGYLTRRLFYPAKVPPKFLFPRPTERKRNANMHGFVNFPRMTSMTNVHRAQYAITAARCLQDAIKIHSPSAQFIVAEKALFMIGYDVVNTCMGNLRPLP